MKLLFDQNISFRVVKTISSLFPNSASVKELYLENKSDVDIWYYAKQHNYTIVTFDSDFIDLAILKKQSPKIIFFRTGNTSTQNIISTLNANFLSIKHFIEKEDSTIIFELYK
ncbi:MAG: DUF5615 family PIN-like protein [Bacteroidetes bacterium]|nr:DUF5615 family PIN-like protein [Bacteroidota bacterium]